MQSVKIILEKSTVQDTKHIAEGAAHYHAAEMQRPQHKALP
jgi:hypothetical protein